MEKDDKYLQDLTEALRNMNSPFIKHYTGTHSDGTKYSLWDLGGVITGDGGMELFNKAIREQADKFLKDLE